MALPLPVLPVDQRGRLLVQRATLVIHLLPAVASMICNVGDDTAQVDRLLIHTNRMAVSILTFYGSLPLVHFRYANECRRKLELLTESFLAAMLSSADNLLVSGEQNATTRPSNSSIGKVSGLSLPRPVGRDGLRAGS
jgi:hypothetical protein